MCDLRRLLRPICASAPFRSKLLPDTVKSGSSLIANIADSGVLANADVIPRLFLHLHCSSPRSLCCHRIASPRAHFSSISNPTFQGARRPSPQSPRARASWFCADVRGLAFSSFSLVPHFSFVLYWFITIISKNSEYYRTPSRSSSLPFVFVSVSYLKASVLVLAIRYFPSLSRRRSRATGPVRVRLLPLSSSPLLVSDIPSRTRGRSKCVTIRGAKFGLDSTTVVSKLSSSAAE